MAAVFSENFERLKKGDFLALGKILSLIERDPESIYRNYPSFLDIRPKCFRLGITGPPGAGKSTLTNCLIGELTDRRQKVGVIAVDPSSPFTQGAVLGDRIRFMDYFVRDDVFIRSLGSRGSYGGLSGAIYAMARAFDWAGFDWLIIETVGVGQVELEIVNVADFVSIVVVPESGDFVQGMKAGLFEVADNFVVNKADRPGADAFMRQLKSSLALDLQKGPPPVIKISALRGEGISQLTFQYLEFAKKGLWKKHRESVSRLRSEGLALLNRRSDDWNRQKVQKINDSESLLNILQNIESSR